MGLKDWRQRIKEKPIGDIIKHKHKFVVMDTDTLKEKLSFQLSGINLFVAIGATIIVLIVLTIVLIAFTPLREYIPGYANTEMVEQTYANARRMDSLQDEVENQEWLIATIQAMLRGENLGADAESLLADSTATLTQVAREYRHSHEDSLLRYEVEREDGHYEVKPSTAKKMATADLASTVPHLFFSPLKGKVMRHFGAAERHYGVDIAGSTDKPVNAAYAGTVAYAGFAADDGHVIVLQHTGNVLTVYRNNSALLKHQGDVVRAGEPIAYVGAGSSREFGPHLHFEVWVNGTAVNPEEYITF